MAPRILPRIGCPTENESFCFKPGEPEGSQRLRSLLDQPRWHSLDRVTYHPDFDAFPMFSSNGKRLVWLPTARKSAARDEYFHRRLVE